MSRVHVMNCYAGFSTRRTAQVDQWSADFREQLRLLNKELLFNFLRLLDYLVDQPSQYARQVEQIGQILRNMRHLLNLLRVQQVALGLLCWPISCSFADPTRLSCAEQCRCKLSTLMCANAWDLAAFWSGHL